MLANYNLKSFICCETLKILRQRVFKLILFVDWSKTFELVSRHNRPIISSNLKTFISTDMILRLQFQSLLFCQKMVFRRSSAADSTFRLMKHVMVYHMKYPIYFPSDHAKLSMDSIHNYLNRALDGLKNSFMWKTKMNQWEYQYIC